MKVTHHFLETSEIPIKSYLIFDIFFDVYSKLYFLKKAYKAKFNKISSNFYFG